MSELFVGKGESARALLLKYANRHGLIAGATGTGKTFTLRLLAEKFSKAGVPVFLADVKGDLNGFAFSGEGDARIDAFKARAEELGEADYRPQAFPTCYWDLYGEKGLPVRTTISELGPMLLARILEVNDTQEGVLNIVFRIADEEGLLLFDLKDLRALLQYVADNAAEIGTKYGNVSAQSVGAIMRQILTLENQGADQFFGEPALDLNDFIRQSPDGRGYVNVLAADPLMRSPRLYATFLLWMLSEFFENLPEVGDQEKPKLVFFFDEAHLLFSDAPPALIQKIEQAVRLIRSKGVGVYFISQNPTDIPDTVLGQLGNRVQHALRAFTPRDQKAVRAAAQTFRANPNLDIETAITELKTGEALVSFLDESGAPTVTETTKIYPPESKADPADPSAVADVIGREYLGSKYKTAIDRESAYEMLAARVEKEDVAAEPGAASETASQGGGLLGALGGLFGGGGNSRRQSVGEAMVKSVARNIAGQIGRQIGRQILRGLFGSLSKR